jgi:hypothetical protein
VASWPEFRPSQLLHALVARGVDFVVIGGYAAIAHGSAQLTRDLDICFARDPVNLRALGAALVELEARPRGVDDPEDLPFVPDERTLQGVQLLTLDTREGPLDVQSEPDGAPGYATLRRRAERVEVAGVRVLVASLDDLKTMKQAAGRPKDLVVLEELEAIRRLSRARRTAG